jgi:lipase maturation factor 1
MWFSAFQNYAQNPWLVHLSVKLMRGDTLTTNLLAKNGNPFLLNGTKPKFIRAQHYEYIFNTDKGVSGILSIWSDHRNVEKEIDKGWTIGKWWKRRLIGEYMPPITVEDPSVLAFLKYYNWY